MTVAVCKRDAGGKNGRWRKGFVASVSCPVLQSQRNCKPSQLGASVTSLDTSLRDEKPMARTHIGQLAALSVVEADEKEKDGEKQQVSIG